jgi:phosphomevalonate kinase
MRDAEPVIASAPGKLILTGEYAVLDGAPALVVAVDRRAVARRAREDAPEPTPFLAAVARELAARGVEAPPVVVDSSAFYEGGEKLGLGSSAAVTVAAVALGLGAAGQAIDREAVLAIAMAAHANAQGERGARGSGADIAAAVYGGTIVFTGGRVERKLWPAALALVPFHTGVAADTATLVARVTEARRGARAGEVEAALAAIGDASRAVIASMIMPSDELASIGAAVRRAVAAPAADPRPVIAAFEAAADAVQDLAKATGVPLVPACVEAARQAVRPLGGTAKTTGAGGGDVGIAVVPASVDASAVHAALIQAGCLPLRLAVEPTGVDVRADVR